MESSKPHSMSSRGILECLTGLKKGDTSALAPLLELTKNRLFKFCFFLTGNHASAHDLAQETHIRLYLNIHKCEGFKTESSFFTWLFTIARHVFLNQQRTSDEKINRHQHIHPEDDQTKGIEKIVDASSSDLDTLIAIQQALSQLSEEDRMILLLIDHEEYTYADVAKIMNMKQPTVCTRLIRARRKLLAILEGTKQESDE